MTMTKNLTAGIVATAIMVTSVFGATASAQTPVNFSGSTKDCDSNAVIYCGASTVSELQSKYAASPSTARIYAHFGISSSDVSAMGTTAVAGSVTKSGEVIVSSKVVAKNALTAGRENISGSTKVTEGGVTFYTRTPSVSFRSNSISAFVVMKDGVFQFAILSACGNPVIATPTTKKPTPTPPKTTPPVTPTTPTTPTPTPVVTTAVTTTTPAALPNTGPGQVVALFAATTVAGASAHYFVRKRRSSL